MPRCKRSQTLMHSSISFPFLTHVNPAKAGGERSFAYVVCTLRQPLGHHGRSPVSLAIICLIPAGLAGLLSHFLNYFIKFYWNTDLSVLFITYSCFCANTAEFCHQRDLRAPPASDTYYLVHNFLLTLLPGNPNLLGDTGVEGRPQKSVQLLKEKKPSEKADVLPVYLKSCNGGGMRNVYVMLISGFPLERSTSLLVLEQTRR